MKFNSYVTLGTRQRVRAHQLTERSLFDYNPVNHMVGLTRLHADSPTPVVGDWLVYYSGEDSALVIEDVYFQSHFSVFDNNAYFETGEHNA